MSKFIMSCGKCFHGSSAYAKSVMKVQKKKLFFLPFNKHFSFDLPLIRMMYLIPIYIRLHKSVLSYCVHDTQS